MRLDAQKGTRNSLTLHTSSIPWGGTAQYQENFSAHDSPMGEVRVCEWVQASTAVWDAAKEAYLSLTPSRLLSHEVCEEGQGMHRKRLGEWQPVLLEGIKEQGSYELNCRLHQEVHPQASMGILHSDLPTGPHTHPVLCIHHPPSCLTGSLCAPPMVVRVSFGKYLVIMGWKSAWICRSGRDHTWALLHHWKVEEGLPASVLVCCSIKRRTISLRIQPEEGVRSMEQVYS